MSISRNEYSETTVLHIELVKQRIEGNFKVIMQQKVDYNEGKRQNAY